LDTSVCAVPPGRFNPPDNHARAEGLPCLAPTLGARAFGDGVREWDRENEIGNGSGGGVETADARSRDV
jgi:hypothetical protein